MAPRSRPAGAGSKPPQGDLEDAVEVLEDLGVELDAIATFFREGGWGGRPVAAGRLSRQLGRLGRFRKRAGLRGASQHHRPESPE